MNRFNVRVYGILEQDGKLLVSDEYIKGKYITKLPGGGLEFGEGTQDCLIREFREELDLAVSIQSHFYTTDFFVSSAFNPHSQIISIYYKVKAEAPLNFPVSGKRFDFKEIREGAQSMRWVSLSELSDLEFTFIIDKRIAEMLAKENQQASSNY